MQLIAPDVLAEMRELPWAAQAVVAATGLAVWSTGWWTHRFWIALAATFAAGLEGLQSGPSYGLHPLAAGLLTAIAAGCVALALGRLVIFSLFGLALWYAVHVLAPQFEVPLACFLIGGLISVLLFRLCVMLLMSAVGGLLLVYGGAVLLESLIHFDAVRSVADQPAALVNQVFAGIVVAGVLAQHLVGRAKVWYLQRRQAWLEFLKKQQANKSAPARPWLLRLLARFKPA